MSICFHNGNVTEKAWCQDPLVIPTASFLIILLIFVFLTLFFLHISPQYLPVLLV